MIKSDYKIGGGWGCHVSWFPDGQFATWDGDENTVFNVTGHHPAIPKEGQTLCGEFTNTFIEFKFIKVDRCANPTDMFFADVVPIKQHRKPDYAKEEITKAPYF